MKKYVYLLLLMVTYLGYSQPVIQNGNNIPLPGYSVPVSTGTPSVGIGNPGANQVWDFSSINFTSLAMLDVINASSSPFASSFPSADYAYTLANTYSYFNVESAKMEVLAYSITAPSSGNDYSPNPRTLVKFPFNYGEFITDTWQKVGGSVNDVTLTYDGYGTLILPAITYQNVVRVKESYNNGDDYQWYILDPFMSVLIYDHNINSLYFINATVTGIDDSKNESPDGFILNQNFPNPFNPTTTIQYTIGNKQFVSLKVYDVLGNEVATLVNEEQQAGVNSVNFNASRFGSGVYFYRLEAGNFSETQSMILIK